jgi:hypothetical protein
VICAVAAAAKDLGMSRTDMLGTKFPHFTRTKVQILTGKALVAISQLHKSAVPLVQLRDRGQRIAHLTQRKHDSREAVMEARDRFKKNQKKKAYLFSLSLWFSQKSQKLYIGKKKERELCTTPHLSRANACLLLEKKNSRVHPIYMLRNYHAWSLC